MGDRVCMGVFLAVFAVAFGYSAAASAGGLPPIPAPLFGQTEPSAITEKSATTKSSAITRESAGTVEGGAGAEPGTAPGPEEWVKPLPLSLSVSYTLASDYIFRGINFSEFDGEGRELPNHQMGAGVGLNTAEFGPNLGVIGFGFWGEWFAGQDDDRFDPASDGHLQEADYLVWWSYDLAAIGTTVELGWISYTFPQVAGDAHSTQEVYAKCRFDDTKLFRTEEPVLSPHVYWGVDYDDAEGGSWVEMGVSHDFALSDVDAVAKVPVLKDLTVTPSAVLGIDNRYLNWYAVDADPTAGAATRLANLVCGLAATHDLGAALHLPPSCGSVTITGFLNYSQAFRHDLLNDELWGGVNVGWSW